MPGRIPGSAAGPPQALACAVSSPTHLPRRSSMCCTPGTSQTGSGMAAATFSWLFGGSWCTHTERWRTCGESEEVIKRWLGREAVHLKSLPPTSSSMSANRPPSAWFSAAPMALVAYECAVVGLVLPTPAPAPAPAPEPGLAEVRRELVGVDMLADNVCVWRSGYPLHSVVPSHTPCHHSNPFTKQASLYNNLLRSMCTIVLQCP